MNKLALTIICLLSYIVSTHAATNVSGQIRSNTTWTKAGSPYKCSGLIEIAPGVSLTLEPGTAIELDLGLDVHGYLHFKADNTDSIFISTISNNNNKTYSINFYKSAFANIHDTFKLQYCSFYNTGITFIEEAPSLLVYKCTFNGTHPTIISWSGGTNTSLVVSNNYIRGGFRTETDPFTIEAIEITCNLFEHHNQNGWALSLASACNNRINIEGNTFYDNYTCIYAQTHAQVYVSNNIFFDNTTAITIPGGDIKYYIENNLFTRNQTAMRLWPRKRQKYEILHNSIYENEKGITIWDINGMPDSIHTIEDFTLRYNCIYDNSEYNVYWGGYNDYDLCLNWWGTVDTIVIDAGIIDFTEDFKKSVITFQPIATSSNNGDIDCKTYTPPTKIPEQKILYSAMETYPNPFSQSFTVKAVGNSTLRHVFVYNRIGERVASISADNKQQVTINVANQPSGMYIYVAITSDNQTITGRVVKD